VSAIAVAPNYGSRPTGRRARADVARIRAALYDLLSESHPMTVRQVFYQLVSRGVIAKTEAEYKGTVVRLLGKMRRNHQIPFHWLADNTRWMRKPRTYSSIRHMLEQEKRLYRRSVWEDQDVYVEVWLEKDALAGVLYDVTEQWDVPLMVTRGYPSLSFLESAAEAIRSVRKPAFLYYFGDFDPSGVDIPRKVERDIRDFASGAEIHFERVAVTRQQIEALGLPTRPTKKTDSRSRDFGDESVEVDAIPPAVLKEMVESCIARHIDEHAYKATLLVESQERETLDRIVNILPAFSQRT
jgi:AcrR family transcriptional regulator